MPSYDEWKARIDGAKARNTAKAERRAARLGGDVPVGGVAMIRRANVLMPRRPKAVPDTENGEPVTETDDEAVTGNETVAEDTLTTDTETAPKPRRKRG